MTLLLAACSGGEGDDLDKFIRNSGDGLKGKVDPLPEVRPLKTVDFNADGTLVDPFVPRKAVSNVGGVQPDLDRPKDAGENYPLESLKFVGAVSKNKQQRALLKTPDNLMLEVKVGEHIGQNLGLVTSITDTEIRLKEIVQDELSGDWVERPTSVIMQE
ncbi:MAG: pilus assembly protein PilP [Methylobacterium sp.]|nr:pilus assembly protein PilP [Methylobacterium sp.]